MEHGVDFSSYSMVGVRAAASQAAKASVEGILECNGGHAHAVGYARSVS